MKKSDNTTQFHLNKARLFYFYHHRLFQKDTHRSGMTSKIWSFWSAAFTILLLIKGNLIDFNDLHYFLICSVLQKLFKNQELKITVYFFTHSYNPTPSFLTLLSSSFLVFFHFSFSPSQSLSHQIWNHSGI